MQFTFAPAFTMPRFLARDTRVLAARPRVTRWQAFGVQAGATRELPRAQGRFVVHCRAGTCWIVHDGEARDVVLHANESYVVDSRARMTAHALRGDCALELQVDA